MKPLGAPTLVNEDGDAAPTPAEGTSSARGEKDDAEKKEAQAPEATVSKTSAIVLICAIGVHAVFEGIAFGL